MPAASRLALSRRNRACCCKTPNGQGSSPSRSQSQCEDIEKRLPTVYLNICERSCNPLCDRGFSGQLLNERGLTPFGSSARHPRRRRAGSLPLQNWRGHAELAPQPFSSWEALTRSLPSFPTFRKFLLTRIRRACLLGIKDVWIGAWEACAAATSPQAATNAARGGVDVRSVHQWTGGR